MPASTSANVTAFIAVCNTPIHELMPCIEQYLRLVPSPRQKYQYDSVGITASV
jgi:hypothetical protein